MAVGVKSRISSSLVRAALLYASETWPTREVDVKTLEVFDMCCLRRLIGGKVTFGMSNWELMARAGLPAVGELVLERRWRFLGHVLRMGQVRWPLLFALRGGA